ncbi:hypothetical protein J7552_10045, partial [Wohlfahrtiimonas chitiniclastica]|uniref:calcium-binding protein n=1 Tax=Wohlfahrtiimonas chitiniclastica TaxID=400946 RepID=UPI001BD8F12C
NGDSIRVQNFFQGQTYWINEIHFADKVITLNDLRAMNLSVNVTVNHYNPSNWSGALTLTGNEQGYNVYGASGNDTIRAGDGNDAVYGRNGNDILYGEEGNDALYGEGGNDTLYGGAGNDKLYGGQGNDVLIGGIGDDYLEGGDGARYGVGNKTYQFSKGDGNDTINNYDGYGDQNNDTDIIKFSDVNSDEVSYRGENYDLIIEYGNGDSIRVQNFFQGQTYWINEIHFADGSVVKQNEIQGLIDAQVNQSLAKTISITNETSRITVDQELHSLISAMASFDSANSSNNDFVVTNDSSLTPIITTSAY